MDIGQGLVERVDPNELSNVRGQLRDSVSVPAARIVRSAQQKTRRGMRRVKVFL